MRSESAPTREETPLVERVVEAIPVAIASAFPAFVRARSIEDAGAETAFAAFALAALVLVAPAIATIALVRRSAEALRSLAGAITIGAAGVTLAAAVLAIAFWERLGAFLAHATHHRGLGGVAFAAGALALAAGIGSAAVRAYRLVEAQGSVATTFAGVAGLFAPLLLASAATTPSAPADALGLFVGDALALLVASFAWAAHLAPSAWPARARALVLAGAVLLGAAAIVALRPTSEFPWPTVAFAFRFLPLR